MSPQLVGLLVTWVLPPALGAVIGWVTNDIAIRMLFRPLTEKRIFGVRLPLTPGIIPRQRHALAESIGRMVSEHLITEETVREHIAAGSFRAGLRTAVASLTRRALDASPAGLGRGALELWRGSLGSIAAGVLRRFFASPGFFASVRGVIARIVSAVGDQLLADAVAPERLESLVRSRLLPMLADGRAARWARGGVLRWVDRRVAENTPVERLLPDSAVDALAEALRAGWPRIREAVLAWLRGPEVHRELESRGRQFVQDVLERMNSLQRFVVSVGQYDRTLSDNMPGIVDDALKHLEEFLEDPQSADRFEQAARSSVGALRRKGMAELGADLGMDLRDKLPSLAERLVSGIDGEHLAGTLGEGVDRFFQRNGSRSLRELAGRTLGLQEHEAVEALSNAALRYLTREETAGALGETLEGFLGGLLREQRPMGELLGISDEQKARLDDFLCDRAGHLLETRLPEFVQGFDIRRMVVDRINKLDVAQVESLLMIVIAKHLKWINVFGALLGALIGLTQSVVALLT